MTKQDAVKEIKCGWQVLIDNKWSKIYIRKCWANKLAKKHNSVVVWRVDL